MVSESNPIRLFVSHVFEKHEDYLRVFEFIESDDRFYYLNFSNPEQIPDTGGKEAMKDVLLKQMDNAELVIVCAGLYDGYRDMIEFTINAAKAKEKPVIVMEHFGSEANVADILSDLADEIVEWNDRTLIDTIKKLARDEDTQRWETIDFPGYSPE